MRWAMTDITPAVPGLDAAALRSLPASYSRISRARSKARQGTNFATEPSVEGAEETMRPLHGGGWDLPLCVRVKSERERERVWAVSGVETVARE
jgi:hypothetical protein